MTTEIIFEIKFGPGKCWKCGIKLSAADLVYEAKDMVGRPSFTKVDYGVYPSIPQFCDKCHRKIDNDK